MICPDCGGELPDGDTAVMEIEPRVPGQKQITAVMRIGGNFVCRYYGPRERPFVEWYHARATQYNVNIHFHWLPLPEKGGEHVRQS